MRHDLVLFLVFPFPSGVSMLAEKVNVLQVLVCILLMSCAVQIRVRCEVKEVECC